ncbi:MAG TPA: ATP-binding protein [Longimicrobiales bacterium]|nr:ATP-binding protein [Longimicrobiales bacterium]
MTLDQTWLPGAGGMAGMIRDHDWARTPAGPLAGWSAGLKTLTATMLGARVPMIVLWGPSFVQIYNDAFSEFMGDKHPGGLGQPARDCWPEAWPVAGPYCEKTLAGESTLLTDAMFRLDRHGEMEDGWFDVSFAPVPDDSGGVGGVFVTVLEKTAQVRAAEALRRSEDKYRGLFNSIDAGFCIQQMERDETGRFVDERYLEVNPAFAAQTGLHDVVGRTAREIFPGLQDSWIEVKARVALTGAPARFQNHVPSLDRWFDVYAFRVGDPEEATVAAVFNDITAQRRAEAELRELNESLERRVGERTSELAKANEALRRSEGKYRALFESMDEGCFLIQVLYDEDGQACDALYLETNSAANRMVGRDWTGLRLGDIDQRFEPYWIETFARVARTGVGERMELYAEPLKAWFDFFVFRAGDEDPSRVVIVFQDITARKRIEAARSEALRQLVTAEEDERRRISRELHDSLGQLVTGLLLGLRSLEGRVADAGRLKDLEQLADRIAREMQNLAVELRPPALDNLGLAAALQAHLEEWSGRHGVDADFHAANLDKQRLSPETETTLYRVAQEALTNVLKHAGASHVSMVLERRRGNVQLIIEDNGRGFDVERVLASPRTARRLGVRGMRERVALVGGYLNIESSPDAGTAVFVRVPDVDPATGA